MEAVSFYFHKTFRDIGIEICNVCKLLHRKLSKCLG